MAAGRGDHDPRVSRSRPRPALGAPGLRTDALVLAAIVAVAAALRVYRLGEQSLWLDELYSYWASRLSWRDLWLEIPRIDKHTPLYYSLLKLWSVFGDGEAALRSPSAVAGTLAVPCAYVLRRLAATPERARWSGAAAALLAAIHPVLIEYSQEARAYSAWAFAVVLAPRPPGRARPGGPA